MVGHHSAGSEVVDSVLVRLDKFSCAMTKTQDENWPSNKFISTAPVMKSPRYLDVNVDVINCSLPSDFVNYMVTIHYITLENYL